MYIRLVLIYVSLSILTVSADDREQDRFEISYQTVAAALESIRKNASASINEQQGWMIATLKEGTDIVSWSFTPEIHPAYPAAIKRTIYRVESGARQMQMAVKCGGPKEECDKLVAEFEELNQQIRESIENGS